MISKDLRDLETQSKMALGMVHIGGMSGSVTAAASIWSFLRRLIGVKMKYFLIEMDRSNQIPYGINKNNIIDIRNINQDNLNKIPQWNLLEVDIDTEGIFPSVLSDPFFMVTRECIDTILLYEENSLYRCVKLFNTKNSRDCTYFIPVLEEVDCLTEGSEFNQDKSIMKKIILDSEKIKNKSIFRIKGMIKPYVLGRMDLLESMLRRGAKGMRLEEVEVS